jgi:hypothetical protein
VQVIGTPKQQGNSWIHFETIQQAIDSEQGAALREILQHKKITANSVHKLLVRDLKVLSHSVADRRPRLPPGTLASRQSAAEVWSKRVPWLTLSNQDEEVPAVAYFDWEYYFNFTFMIDACSFEDGPCSGVNKSKRVYRIPDRLWGPELEEDEQSIAKGTKLMYYVVMHPHGGLVVGPDLVFTGNRVPSTLSNCKEAMLTEWHESATPPAERCTNLSLLAYCPPVPVRVQVVAGQDEEVWSAGCH